MMKPLQESQLVPQGGGESIPLMRDRLVVGRRESCDICLKFPNISGRHCELILKDGAWILQDLNSTNGVKVNGIKVTSNGRKLLHTGDVLTIGKRNFVLHYEEVIGKHVNEMLEDIDEDILAQPLLERAGLVRPKKPKIRQVMPNEKNEDGDD